MDNVKSVIIVGVGGQGTLLASKILGNLLVEKGYDVKVSEVHGMAQRGGSVVTYVRYGEKVYSPIIDLGGADMMLAFERMEALRWLSYLKKNGTVIMNTQIIEPMPVITGAMQYPEQIEEKIKAYTKQLISVDAFDLASKAGNTKAVNVVLLGLLAKNMDFDKQEWIDVLVNTVPPKFLDANILAFELGYNVNQ